MQKKPTRKTDFMSFNHSTREEGNVLKVELIFPANSEVSFPFLENNKFSKIELGSNRLAVELPKTPDIDKQLEKGVIVNSKHYSLSKPSYAKPTAEYQPIKPSEKPSFKEIRERWAAQGILSDITSTVEELSRLEKKVPPTEEPSSTAPIKIQCCPECNSTNLRTDYDAGEIVCTNCGFVTASKLTDRGPEWRAFDDEQKTKRTRAGAPLTYTIHDKGLSTMIDWHDKDVYGKNLSPGQKSQVYRLRKWQRRIRVSDATERNMARSLSETTRIAENLNLPKSVHETASVIYRKAVKERLVRGRSIQSITAAAIYLACRRCGLAKSLEEVAQASNVDKKELGRSYRFLIQELNYPVPPLKPSQYVTKFSNQLTMQGKSEEIAYKILEAAKELKLTSGRGPQGLAAAASYIASVLTGDRRTQKDIAETAQVTEVTIRNRYKDLVEKLTFHMTL